MRDLALLVVGALVGVSGSVAAWIALRHAPVIQDLLDDAPEYEPTVPEPVWFCWTETTTTIETPSTDLTTGPQPDALRPWGRRYPRMSDLTS